ncbi:cytidine deaminase [Acholeplasma sp. OttesenSCG-928-E16]|nr:cytidine deaminase [Acholeplasma sp. OttesenSCG-928-E16]
MNSNSLILEAKKAMEKAYAPYSKFKVGAAVLLEDGTIIHGANIENSSYGLSNCAERSALFSTISQGFDTKKIKGIAIIGDTKDAISPCGACRQVIRELVPKNAVIYLCNLDGKVIETNIDELLPFSFDLFEDSK